MQSGERVAITPVGLDPITAPFRHAESDASQTRTGRLRTRSATAGSAPECPDDLRHGPQVAGDHPVVTDLARAPLLGERDIDRQPVVAKVYRSLPTVCAEAAVGAA